jgi:TnpA family transposase
MANNRRLTSVKIDENLFELFKEKCVADVFTFQKLAERSIYLYLTDEEFRKKILNQLNTVIPK